MRLALVELVRDEPADVLVHSVGLIEEDPAIRTNQFLTVEDVFKDKSVCARKVRALKPLGSTDEIHAAGSDSDRSPAPIEK